MSHVHQGCVIQIFGHFKIQCMYCSLHTSWECARGRAWKSWIDVIERF